jgi:methionine-rich copper-binding protein CopC
MPTRSATAIAPTAHPRRLRGWVLAIASVLGLLLAMSSSVLPASAHDELVSSSPAAGAALDPAPSEVTLSYSDNVLEVGVEVSVTDAGGTQWVSGAPVVDGPNVSTPLASDMPAGSYTVEWRVVSSDGHPISGTIPFTVTTPVATNTSTPTPAASEPPVVATPTTDAASPAPGDASESASDGPTGAEVALYAGIGLAILVLLAAVLLLAARRRRSSDDERRDRREDLDGRDA